MRCVMHRIARFIALWLGMWGLLGCQHTYKEVPATNLPRPRLRSDAIVYVPIPPDGLFKKHVAANSGKLTAVAVRDGFAKHVKRAYVGRMIESMATSLETARQHRCTYVAYPSIVRWEDRATEFSGVKDKMEIKIEVVEAATGEILHTTVLQGKSRWLTDGGDRPQDLLEKPIEDYVASLFQSAPRSPSK
ncbi:MAG: DUF4823 domain-containing protein [Verrucomicrobia bacterium]|nr:DUF4823 domain-containing protein [Verrucomicrobiota bacterium]